MKQKLMRFVSKSAMFTASFGLVFSSLAPMAAHAANISAAMDILTRVQDSASANHTIQFNSGTAVNASSDTITITFPAAWGDIGAGFGIEDVDLETKTETCTATSSWSSPTTKTLAASAAAGTWGVSTSATVLTLTAPTDAGVAEIAAGDCIRIEIGTNATTGSAGDTQLANAAAGSHLITVGGTFGDSGTIAVDIIADDTIGTSANVDPSIDFEVGMNATQATLCTASSDISVTSSLDLGTISSGSINYDGYICTRLDTNATNGATVFMQSVASGGVGGGQLTSSSATGDDIPDAANSATGEDALVAGTEDYKACVSEASGGTGSGSGGSPTIDTDFDSNGQTCDLSVTTVGADVSTSQEAIWSVSAPTTNAFGNLVILTTIAGQTEAHNDYTDYLVFTAAASF